ncbi:MAG: glutathione S-transferase family protein, partial [Sphingomonadales bacterium]
VDYLVGSRRWIGGPLLSLADLACAAHISVADYLGGIDWRGHEETKQWYSGMKSRRSLRVILSERMELVGPPEHYEKPDF